LEESTGTGMMIIIPKLPMKNMVLPPKISSLRPQILHQNDHLGGMLRSPFWIHRRGVRFWGLNQVGEQEVVDYFMSNQK
jgi:hypothetical protein